jgi:cell division septation protein DedD
LLSAQASAQSVKAGIAAWQKADYSAAVAIWTPLALRGDADAQFNLGQAYRMGRGVPLNLAAAENWFEKAAAAGHLDAQTTLGLLLFQNGDQAHGLQWLRRAAEKGEPRAQLVYGTALYNGDGVGQDRLLGYAYVRRAAGQGLGAARETLDQLDSMMSAADKRKAEQIALASPKPAHAAPAAKPPKPVRVAEAKPPTARPAQAPAPKTLPPVAVAHGSWRIQLGAFGQRSSAEALYHRVAGKPALSGRSPIYISVGSMTRLQVGPFESRAAAAAACGSIGTACFPGPAK